MNIRDLSVSFVIAVLSASFAAAQERDQVIPHAQDVPPGPALTPQQAIAKMTVPEGFSVELVASEPDIVNPVAMTFDEQGRIWITESLEYPRRSPGPGRDRIKVLEDTDHDGVADRFTVFAEGLNIPSGIAVGHGGVWVANAPDILFMRDTDGDLKADTSEVVVTGFGRFDTHELPNSLTWGPDGWLYGLNGVFNRSVVKTQDETFDFTCALFRIDPRTRRFELFAEGTSNPWGVAWNPVGDAFLSACVIDHLWHLTETGYYHRQGGPYPPHTWKLESIVDHKHQKAAYCGIHYFDSDAYPAEYRDRLYMGNIHGNCVNVDVLEDRGATYFAKPAPDFLSANDAWFMPVVQKTGPDGCLYVLDWYDRYHCYQDANRDPEGIDRLKGRLYRIRYQDTPRAPAFDVASESSAQLVERLRSPNVYFRDIAQRIFSERASPEDVPLLEGLVLSDSETLRTRMHALWSLAGAGPLRNEFLAAVLELADDNLRAWGVRIAGNQRVTDEALVANIHELRFDDSPRVRVQVAIAAPKLDGLPTMPTLIDVLSASGDDRIIPSIVWQNLHPLLEDNATEFIAAYGGLSEERQAQVSHVMPRVIDRLLASESPDTKHTSELINLLFDQRRDDRKLKDATAPESLRLISQRVQDGELSLQNGLRIFEATSAVLQPLLNSNPPDVLSVDVAEFTASLGLESGLEVAAKIVRERTGDNRVRMMRALVAGNSDSVLQLARELLQSEGTAADEQRQLLQVIGDFDSPEIAALILNQLASLPENVRPVAIETLTGRTDWGLALMNSIAAGDLPPETLNANQARKLLSLNDETLSGLLKKHWGTVRTERDPDRDRFVRQMDRLLHQTKGDPVAGQAVFKKVCGQCHKMYGEGAEVGPDITRNGRSSYDQLLSNVFDPSLVIGAAYQAVTVVTTDGKVINGLPVEDNDQRIVLKVQGDKQETIPRSKVEEQFRSELSLMPEGLEKQLTPQEIADLFALLVLDRPPGDPNARRIPGAE
ncbi:MAG: c-type cytochrome [Planctomycetaceae bacterium]